jgi:hypothetical protein
VLKSQIHFLRIIKKTGLHLIYGYCNYKVNRQALQKRTREEV